MIDFNQNTLTRRYTATDFFGYGAGGGGLTKAMINRQNRVCGFESGNTDFPIRVEQLVDSVVFRQGRGPVKVAMPELKDEESPDRAGSSRQWQ